MTRRAPTLLALVCALCLGLPALAGAASNDTPSAATTDCNDHGKLTAQYSAATLQQALEQMPVDVREYTDCYDVIERQLLAEQGKASPGSASTAPASSSGSFLPTWLIVVIVLLALAAVTFGALAIRRRNEAPAGPSGSSGSGGAPPPPGAGGSEPPSATGESESGEGGPGGPPTTSP